MLRAHNINLPVCASMRGMGGAGLTRSLDPRRLCEYYKVLVLWCQPAAFASLRAAFSSVISTLRAFTSLAIS